MIILRFRRDVAFIGKGSVTSRIEQYVLLLGMLFCDDFVKLSSWSSVELDLNDRLCSPPSAFVFVLPEQCFVRSYFFGYTEENIIALTVSIR